MIALIENSVRSFSCKVLPAALLSALILAAPAMAQDRVPSLLDEPPMPPVSDDIKQFCTNIADAARERRYALQKDELLKLQSEIESKITILEEKRADLQFWVSKREEFAKAASTGLIDVYSKMRPDAAAQRMEKLPGELSAALLSKLNPRMAGTILNEMSAERAAMVTMIMSAAGDTQIGIQ
jgi:flagellar motility protein MotE (MotC chaperone)